MMSESGGGTADLVGRPWYAANAALAFVLELTALGCLGGWGFTVEGGIAARLSLGLGSPALAAVLWGLFAAPRARIRLPLPGVLFVKALVFGGASLAVHVMGHTGAAVVLAAVMITNMTLGEAFRNSPSRSR